jgi:hypothetical protein
VAKIVAARLEHGSDAEAVLSALSSAGFKRTEFQSFYVNPEGQHALYPIGGDAHSDEGARGAGRGTFYGAAAGGLIGIAIGYAGGLLLDSPSAPLAGTAVGAYLGSLLGTLAMLHSGKKTRATVEHPVERPAGQMIAIRVDQPGTDTRAIETLKRYGARNIECTEGEWRAGDWKDFDPRIPSKG